MPGLPTIADVIAYLEARGEADMAYQVARMQEMYRGLRETNERNVEAYNALRAKHEPPTFRYRNYTSPPESDG